MKKIDIFGWSPDVWAEPLYNCSEFQKTLGKRGLRILEIGADRFSVVSLCFDETESSIVVGYYNEKSRQDIERKLSQIKSNIGLQSSYELEYIDAFDVPGKFDVIIMKSVLGGLFRIGKTSLDDVNDFLLKLARENIKDRGALITIDNGRSLYESLLFNYGARKNSWRFFSLREIAVAKEQTSFGFLSAFSFGTRFARFGGMFDRAFYLIDSILCLVLKNNPTVICSVLSHHPAQRVTKDCANY